jgi:glycosyltransferase involved in cell wall biosynthesis
LLKAAPDRARCLRQALPGTVVFHEPRLYAVQAQQDALAQSRWPWPVKLAGKLALRVLRDACFWIDVALLRREIAAIRPDYVEAVNGGYPGGMVCLAACVAARSLGVQKVGLTALRDPQARKLGDGWLDRLIARSVDLIRSSSGMSSEAFVSRREMPMERLRTVHTGLQPQPPAPRAWSTAAGESVAGYCSVFVEAKGHLELLRAAAALKDRRPELLWVLTGDGPTRAEMEAQAKRLGLDGRVLFPGWVDEAQAIAGFDLLVHPSGQENFPTAILEAMRCGKPIVAARVGGVPEQVEDGVSALLVPPRDAAATAAAVERLLADRELARRLGGAARERFLAEFTVERMRRSFFEPALLA